MPNLVAHTCIGISALKYKYRTTSLRSKWGKKYFLCDDLHLT
jgi:hypothetical protein